MARRSQDDYCLACTSAPCACKKNKPAVRSLSVKRTCEPLVTAVKAAPTAKRAGLSAVKSPPPKIPSRTSLAATRSNDDADLRRAVTILVEAGLVDEYSIAEHRALIDLTDTQIRAILWKQRRTKTGGE